MRYFAVTALFFFFPLAVQAGCSPEGYSVVFINGIFNSQEEAQDSAKALWDKLGFTFGGQSLTVFTGYNASHLEGAGDLVELYAPSLNQYDVDTILLNLHKDLTTRKVLLVGHSQGGVYANRIYEYLTTHGMPAANVAVYAVGMAASYVAGGGKYITYTLDETISAAEFAGLHPLSANVDFLDFLNTPDNHGSPVLGHGFVDMYLAGFGTRMVGEMRETLGQLQAQEVSAKEGCFDPPKQTFARAVQGAGLAVADPVATGVAVAGKAVKNTAVAVKNVTVAAAGAIGGGVQAVGGWFGFGGNTTAASESEKKPSTEQKINRTGFVIIKSTVGSSLDLKTFDELIGLGPQGGAVALAPIPSSVPPKEQGEVKGVATEAAPQTVVPQSGGDVVIVPGFGGGGGESVASSGATATENSTTTPDLPTPTSTPPAAPTTTVTAGVTVVVGGGTSITVPQGNTYLLASSTSVWQVQLIFDEPLSVGPTVRDGSPTFAYDEVTPAPFGDGTFQNVNDCNDGDARTFCFVYVPPAHTVTMLYWYFQLSNAFNLSGSRLATSSDYKFLIDTEAGTPGPSLATTTTPLPLLTGSLSEYSVTIYVEIGGVVHTADRHGSEMLWNLQLVPGEELTEGYKTVRAWTVDGANNTSAVVEWLLPVDLDQDGVVLP